MYCYSKSQFYRQYLHGVPILFQESLQKIWWMVPLQQLCSCHHLFWLSWIAYKSYKKTAKTNMLHFIHYDEKFWEIVHLQRKEWWLSNFHTTCFSIDVSGIIEKFNIYVTLAIIPRTINTIELSDWFIFFIKTLGFSLLGRKISLLYHVY